MYLCCRIYIINTGPRATVGSASWSDVQLQIEDGMLFPRCRGESNPSVHKINVLLVVRTPEYESIDYQTIVPLHHGVDMANKSVHVA